nr:cell division protein FtsQ/DivIB [Aquamicrobium sp. LC103]
MRSGRSDFTARRGWLPASGSFVLPRWLRRPARFFGRMTSGEVEAPPFAATILSAVFLGATGIYGAVQGGHMPVMVQATTARTGFAVDEIRVSGNLETSEIDIFDRVGLDGWTSLVGFNAEAARERIRSLPWVESATVRKVYPSTLEVKIVEKTPFAIWQRGSQLSLIEEDGKVIAPLTGVRHLNLPLVIGEGAETRAATFVAEIAGHTALASKVRGYVRISDRRWNLRLRNGITIKLPEHDVDSAITDLLALDRQYDLLSRDVASVDMRFGDRLVVRLTPDAATAREAALKERLGKNYKPRERQI